MLYPVRMRSSSLLPAALVSVLALAAACGGAAPTPATPPVAGSSSASPLATTAPTAAPDEVVAPATWSSDLPKPQAVAFMKKNVAPRMGKAFQAHDAARYAAFGCKTCHGPEYKVPKDFLPKLTMQGGKLTAFADKPELAKFMHEVVVPEMAAALGQQPYDPQTQKGFGCMGCHAVEMKP